MTALGVGFLSQYVGTGFYFSRILSHYDGTGGRVSKPVCRHWVLIEQDLRATMTALGVGFLSQYVGTGFVK